MLLWYTTCMRRNEEEARLLREMGAQNFRTSEGVSFCEHKILRAQQSTRISRKAQTINKAQAPYRSTEANEEDTKPMALLTATKGWLSKHGIEGFILVAKAPPHEEPEKVAATINVEELSKVTT